MLLIKNGQLIPGQGGAGDIFIKDGVIHGIGRGIRTGDSDAPVTVIDAAGMVVAPGLVDIHAHFRDPGFTAKEDLASGARAAAAGGYTSVVLMANTRPPVDEAAVIADIGERGRRGPVNVHTVANVTKGMAGRQLVDMAALAGAGAVGFSDDGLPLLDPALTRAAMTAAARLGLPLCLHEEDPADIVNNGINEGRVSAALGIGGAARAAEITMVERDLGLAAATGATVVFQHISTGEAVALIREAKKTNRRIHAEATPHHFTLTEEAVLTKGTQAKMNPPLRTESDRLAIIEGLRDGTIDIIATDHAPHTAAEKEQAFTAAPSGIIGLETALSLGIRELVDRGHLTLAALLDLMAANPARVFGLPAGRIAIGARADLVIFDPKATWTVAGFHSRSANSPFIGETLPGVVKYTICGGEIIHGCPVIPQYTNAESP